MSAIFFLIILAVSSSFAIFSDDLNNQTPPKRWIELFTKITQIIQNTTQSNMLEKYRDMQDVADSTCGLLLPSKSADLFLIANYTENTAAKLNDDVRENMKFYMTKVLTDALNCN